MLLRLEAIGDNLHQAIRSHAGFLDSIAPGLGDAVVGKGLAPFWVAEITGLCGKFGFKRHFLRGQKDYSEANSVGSRGVYVYYDLPAGKIFEVKEQISWKRDDRYFLLADLGSGRRLDKAEVEEALSTSRRTAMSGDDARISGHRMRGIPESISILTHEESCREPTPVDPAEPWRQPLGIDVLTAARRRIAATFDRFPRLLMSFSGGKDSGALLQLVADEARRRKRRVGVLFIDWEAQFKLTIDYVRERFLAHADWADPYWVCLPLRTTNACSYFEPEWTCWDPAKREAWVRDPPEGTLTFEHRPSFYSTGMTFEEFVPAFAEWYAGGKLTAVFVGIRCAESLNRWRAITGGSSRFESWPWTTYKGGTVYNSYPIYDWRTEDVWRYYGTTGAPYNPLYNLMHQAGIPLSQMRICEPYGDEQRRGLWLYQVVEPETWGRVVARVAGANSAALYAGVKGNVMGNGTITKPDRLTWQQFAEALLDTMPEATADHYRDKIAVYRRWCSVREGLDEMPEEADGDTGSKDIASWRRICKVLLRGDYWCKALSFSPTKTASYDRYRKIMKKRRSQWGIYA